MGTQPKLTAFTTSRGVAKFCHLNKPQDKFKPEGEYSVTFVQTPEDSQKFRELIDKEIQQAVAQAKRDNPKTKSIKRSDPPYKLEVDQDGNETGNYQFKFKCAASGKRKDGTVWTFRPAVFDAKGKPFNLETAIWGGSVIKVSCEIKPYYTAQIGAGVSLRLKAVQVLDLKTGQGKDASGYGFVEEEGYSGSEATDEATTEASSEGVEGGGDF